MQVAALASGLSLGGIQSFHSLGVAPLLRLVNRGADKVFLLDGEELAGAKQNRILNLSILAGPDLLARLLPKLVRSYGLDVFDEEKTGGPAPAVPAGMQAIHAALAEVVQLSPTRHRAIGRGQDLRLSGGSLVGDALIADGAVVHPGLWADACC